MTARPSTSSSLCAQLWSSSSTYVIRFRRSIKHQFMARFYIFHGVRRKHFFPPSISFICIARWTMHFRCDIFSPLSIDARMWGAGKSPNSNLSCDLRLAAAINSIWHIKRFLALLTSKKRNKKAQDFATQLQLVVKFKDENASSSGLEKNKSMTREKRKRGRGDRIER